MSADSIRVMTYNLHSIVGTDGVADWQRIADIVKGAQPDLLGLEEVTINHARSPGVDVAKTIGEYMGMTHTFSRAVRINEGRGEYGIAALAKCRMRVMERLLLPTPEGIEPRTAIPGDPAEMPPVPLPARPCWSLARVRLSDCGCPRSTGGRS